MTLYLVLLLGSGLMLSLVVLVAGSVIWLYRKIDRDRTSAERMDHLMPRHVWQVTLSYSGLGIAAVVPMSRTLREAIAFVSLALGLNAILLVFAFHRDRTDRNRPPIKGSEKLG